MTTIIINCKTLEVATDSQTTCNMSFNGEDIPHTLHYESSLKLREPEPNVIYVGAGDRAELEGHYKCFVRNGHIGKSVNDEVMIAIIRKKHNSLHVDIHDSFCSKKWWRKDKWVFETRSIVSDSDVMAFGSGGKYAYGAIKAGVSVKDAILVASECDECTDDNVQYYKFS